MIRAEFNQELNSWSASDLRELLVRIYFDRRCPKKNVIGAIMAIASDNEINGALEDMGKEARLTGG